MDNEYKPNWFVCDWDADEQVSAIVDENDGPEGPPVAILPETHPRFAYATAMLPKAPQLFEELYLMASRAARVVERWSGGDLAGAVRELEYSRQSASKLLAGIREEIEGSQDNKDHVCDDDCRSNGCKASQ